MPPIRPMLRDWATAEDGWFAVPHGEIVARVT